MAERNLVYILHTSTGPDGWALATVEDGVPRRDATWVGVYEVSDEVAEALRGLDEPQHHWDEIQSSPGHVLDWDGTKVALTDTPE